ncbi:hypothetical protein COU61_04975 [Candidatus Pacearchaeota archaeon CG10_big_fil_rev_8_21_14_0_10_35_13]|nr:MAG: hypothetical protein COU61_04975 [Candidatus Pacearchaeota archaeon CG10_big_fil_rev_8_21_14_0_10_35_13]
MKEEIIKAIEELKKDKRKFEQGVDFIINLKKFDTKRESVNTTMVMPNKFRKYKIAAFLNNKSTIVTTVTKAEFPKYADKKKVKKLIKNNDYFIAAANLMPTIATTFGKYLGPSGKMPAPGRGIIASDDEASIKREIEKFEGLIRIKTKESSIKILVGKENTEPEKVAENAEAIYKTVLNNLQRGKDNIKSVMIKLTMSKPIKINY